MPAIDYTYDPTGENPANRIELEVFDVLGRGFVPLHGPFYAKGLKVEARLGSNPWQEIYEVEHYNFSPLFVRVTAATGLRAYSYLYLNIPDMATFSQVRISYNAVGEYEDTPVLTKVAALTQTERQQVYSWRKIQNVSEYPIDTRDPELVNKDIMEVISAGLIQIRSALDKLNRAGAANFDVVAARLEEKYTIFESQLQQILNGGNDPADSEQGDPILATFVGLLGTADSDTYRPFETTQYRYLDIWTSDGSSFPEAISIQIFVNGTLSETVTLEAGEGSKRVTLATEIPATFATAMRIRASNPSAVAGNVHARLYQRQV